MIKQLLRSLKGLILTLTFMGLLGLMGCDSSVSESAFLEASKNGEVTIVEQYEGDTSVTDANGWTALHLASYGGHTEVVRILLDRKATIDVETTGVYNEYKQVVPLHLAVNKGHIPVIKLLLERGAYPLSQDGNGRNAIFFTEDKTIHSMIWDAMPDDGV